MFGRIFGRNKDDRDEAVCAECGRTLLAGEWTQTVVDEHGNERLICSLCGQAYAGHADPVAASPAPANNGRVRETRSESRYDEPFEPAAVAETPDPAGEPEPERDTRAESDAFWQALKDKDAQIERLKAQLARAEAERQELAGRFARLGTAGAAEEEPEPGSLTGDSSEPGERTWGETPAEFAAEMAALREAEAAGRPREVWDEPAPEPAFAAGPAPFAEPAAPAEHDEAGEAQPIDEVPEPAASSPTGDEDMRTDAAAESLDEAAGVREEPAAVPSGVPAAVFEDTQPIDIIAEDVPVVDDGEDASTGEIAAAEAAVVAAAAGGSLPGEVPAEEPVQSAAEAEAAAASLTLLQRGVDLLNVSKVPRKIAETNEQLGLPHVHAGFDGEIVTITFMWTMGWYRFAVDLDSGDVRLDDRGYEDLGLQPNAGVRADGTVQLAPAQISRAAAQRAQAQPEPEPEPEPEVEDAESTPAPAAGPETPREAAQKPPEFLSKSLLGQRSDDEAASWEQTKARDFDWDR